ncbi:hypothetical protein WR25_04073 [Diploscapter pachys]|uniref:Uncharacterized protein n=1 Tax=Diploscapter pachys TaxID=2018661 RepID=A0A2A2J5Q7_9BILA|nr:hypothetical protein WR25_04073 [Diploscapter pachys]
MFVRAALHSVRCVASGIRHLPSISVRHQSTSFPSSFEGFFAVQSRSSSTEIPGRIDPPKNITFKEARKST